MRSAPEGSQQELFEEMIFNIGELVSFGTVERRRRRGLFGAEV